jgi:hypothetical protein
VLLIGFTPRSPQINAKVCVVGGAGGIGQPMSMLLKSEFEPHSLLHASVLPTTNMPMLTLPRGLGATLIIAQAFRQYLVPDSYALHALPTTLHEKDGRCRCEWCMLTVLLTFDDRILLVLIVPSPQHQ